MPSLASRFRFRSADRDRNTDLTRCESMRIAIRAGIEGIDKELATLKARHDAALVSATFLCGTDVSDARDRDSRTDSELQLAEENLLRAQKRMQHLTKHRHELEELERRLTRIFRDEEHALTKDATG